MNKFEFGIIVLVIVYLAFSSYLDYKAKIKKYNKAKKDETSPEA